jgi:hypothetical protein
MSDGRYQRFNAILFAEAQIASPAFIVMKAADEFKDGRSIDPECPFVKAQRAIIPCSPQKIPCSVAQGIFL